MSRELGPESLHDDTIQITYTRICMFLIMWYFFGLLAEPYTKNNLQKETLRTVEDTNPHYHVPADNLVRTFYH